MANLAVASQFPWCMDASLVQSSQESAANDQSYYRAHTSRSSDDGYGGQNRLDASFPAAYGAIYPIYLSRGQVGTMDEINNNTFVVAV